MKSSFPIKCGCGHELTLEATGNDKFLDTACPNCHSPIWIIHNGIVSTRVFNKAFQQANAGDFTLAIILSAMAVECDLARLYVKWKEIELIGVGVMTPSQADKDSWEETLRGWTRITTKLDKICEYLTTEDFDLFIANRPDLKMAIHVTHPASNGVSSFKYFFQEQLFWKRNQIVHFGRIDFAQPDAEDCLQLAATLLKINAEEDFVRNKILNNP
jgi:hypothetical protein